MGVWGELGGIDGWRGEHGGLGSGAIVTALLLCSRWCSLVMDVAGSEMARSRACWGELGGWGKDWVCSKGSGMVFCRF